MSNENVGMDLGEGITVGIAAARVGVTVRTLHHWDRIGLAGPSGRSSGGYRLYLPGDVKRLRRVVAYREGGLSLEEIGDVLDSASSDVGRCCGSAAPSWMTCDALTNDWPDWPMPTNAECC